MKKTVIALYPTLRQANSAVAKLYKENFTSDEISLVVTEATKKYENFTDTDLHDKMEAKETAKDAAIGAGTGAVAGGIVGALAATVALVVPVAGPVIVAGPLATLLTGAGIGAGIGAVIGGLTGALTDSGVPEEEAQLFTEGVRRGGALVVVSCDDSRTSDASSILDDFDPVDLEETKKLWSQRGWKGFDKNAKPFTPETIEQERSTLRTRSGKDFTSYSNTTPKTRVPTNGRMDAFSENDNDATINVIEEDLKVGKRIQGGDQVHIDTKVVSEPVRENIKLRKENIEINRTPVNEPVRNADAFFQEGSIEMKEYDEEAVVAKEARIKEKISVKKNVTYEDKTIREDVRHTEVSINENTQGQDFSLFEPKFKKHYTTTYKSQGFNSYDQVRPAYKLGYALAARSEATGTDWSKVEPKAREEWTSKFNASERSTWEKMKDAVQHGWKEAKEAYNDKNYN